MHMGKEILIHTTVLGMWITWWIVRKEQRVEVVWTSGRKRCGKIGNEEWMKGMEAGIWKTKEWVWEHI